MPGVVGVPITVPIVMPVSTRNMPGGRVPAIREYCNCNGTVVGVATADRS